MVKLDQEQQKYGCSILVRPLCADCTCEGPPSVAPHNKHAALQAVSQDDGQDLDPQNRQGGGRGPRATGGKEGAPEQGAVVPGSVASIRSFGVFVAMDGWRQHGLVHARQVLYAELRQLPTCYWMSCRL